MVHTTGYLVETLPTEALRLAFYGYDEELDDPALMTDDYIQYMVGEGELTLKDKTLFEVWKAIPSCLRVPPEVRTEAWIANPPRAGRAFEVQHIQADEASVAEFKRQAEEERRIASLNRIAKMKSKLAMGKIDPKTHRWDQRRGKYVPLEPWALKKVAPMHHVAKNGLLQSQAAMYMLDKVKSGPALIDDLSLVTKANAEQIAKLNGVWKPEYGSLQAGLMTMTVKNRLKRLVNPIVFE